MGYYYYIIIIIIIILLLLLLLLLLLWPPVKVALDISGGPIENQWGSGKYPG